MKQFLCALFVIAAAATQNVFAEEIKLEDGVLVLTKTNFKSAVADNEFVLVEFYAPWCGHCKALAPEYAKAAQKLAEDGSPIKLGKVDATEEGELAEEYGVRGYPTLKFYRNGVAVEYTGGRQADDIVTWVTKKTGPPAVELESLEAIEKFLKDNEIAIVGFFADRESEEAKEFLAGANGLDTFIFGITSNAELLGKYEASSSRVILFKPFDEKKTVMSEAITQDNLKKFVQTYSLPLIVDFNHQSAAKIFGGAVKSHMLFFVSKEQGHVEKYVEPLKDIAADYRDEILFVTISADEEDHARIFEFFGMSKEEIPTIRLIKLEEDMAKYKPPTSDLTHESVKSFVEDFMAGKLKQHLLSQELPEDWDKTPVKTLVATNFDEVALNPEKDVLVEFYAPWCGHCKQLVPIYDQLGEKYKDHPTIVIAKMDSTINELEHTKITSFPTLKFYRKGDNQVIDYNMDRTFEDFVKFLDAGGEVAAPGEINVDDAVEVTNEEEAAEGKIEKDEL